MFKVVYERQGEIRELPSAFENWHIANAWAEIMEEYSSAKIVRIERVA